MATSPTLPDAQLDMLLAVVNASSGRLAMIVTDPNKRDNPIIAANDAFAHLSGYPREELVGRNCRFLQGVETDRETVEQMRLAVTNKREFATEILNYRKDGSTFWNALSISPVFNKAGKVVCFLGSLLDVSQRRSVEIAQNIAATMESVPRTSSA